MMSEFPPKRLRYLPIAEIEPGMVLGQPVHIAHRNQRALSFPAGLELTDSNIRQLFAHQAECICIAEDDPRSEAERQADWQRHDERLASIFQLADPADSTTAALHAALRQFRRS